LSDIKESLDEQISPIFEDAKSKLEEINQEAYKKKRDIVIELAKKLEDIISQTDTICKMIVNRLYGKVTGRFIRQCLPAKYKQEYRRKNAKKQKKKYYKESELAAKTPLNQQEYQEEEEEKQNDKVAVMVGAVGSAYTQIKEDNSTETESEAHADSPSKDKIFAQSFFSSQQQQLEQNNNNQFKKYDDRFNNETEDSNRNDIHDYNFEQGDLHEKASSLTSTANKAKIIEGVSVEHPFENDNDILPFEFPINRRTIQHYLGMVKEDEIWINGTINTITKKITHSFGRLVHQNSAEKSCRNDTATTYTVGDRENGQ
jgi:hypothetical protein